MTFEEYLVNPYDQNSFLIGSGVILGLVVFFVLFLYCIFSPITKIILAIMVTSFIGFLGMFVIGFNLAQSSWEIDRQNNIIAEKNLKAKYDIEGVLWTESIASFSRNDGRYDIKVQDADSNILKFRYKIDKETREPYLLNEENTNGSIKSKDLLLNKTEK